MASRSGSPPPRVKDRLSRPVNLTAAAEPMAWEQACRSVEMKGSGDGALEVRGVCRDEFSRANDGARDMVYVVITGYGVLSGADGDMPCTAGDVLFVPRGYAHRFERLDGEVRIWSVSLAAP